MRSQPRRRNRSAPVGLLRPSAGRGSAACRRRYPQRRSSALGGSDRLSTRPPGVRCRGAPLTGRRVVWSLEPIRLGYHRDAGSADRGSRRDRGRREAWSRRGEPPRAAAPTVGRWLPCPSADPVGHDLQPGWDSRHPSSRVSVPVSVGWARMRERRRRGSAPPHLPEASARSKVTSTFVPTITSDRCPSRQSPAITAGCSGLPPNMLGDHR